MYRGLCDLCAKPLRNSRKISLSAYDTVVPDNALEPMMHAECARTCLEYCPALRAQQREGRLCVRVVYRWRARPLITEREALERFLPDYSGPPLVGLAAIDLVSWRETTI